MTRAHTMNHTYNMHYIIQTDKMTTQRFEGVQRKRERLSLP